MRATDRTGVAPQTALVPAGEFMMGDDSGRPDERPRHLVRTRAFRMALTPVTNDAYRAFLEASGHEPSRFWTDTAFNAPDQPVVGVSWFDAVAFCAWLSELSGAAWRLPTEAEREKAARGVDDEEPQPWPDSGRFTQEAPFAVGLSRPNGYGLFDLTYNVHEWCSDWYDGSFYAASPLDDPRGPDAGVRRASRGGAWRHQVKVSRASARSSLDPTFRYNDYGFRLVHGEV